MYAGRRANIKKWPENIGLPVKNFGATPPVGCSTFNYSINTHRYLLILISQIPNIITTHINTYLHTHTNKHFIQFSNLEFKILFYL